MPGIFGIVEHGVTTAARQRELIDVVRQMAAAMLYEPSYTHQIVSLPAVGACVGRVERAAPRPRSAVEYANDRLVITAGDFSPDPGRETREHRLTVDAAVALTGGRCAAFVADSRARASYLLNDRYGRERLFIHRDDARTVFSSEAKAILAVVAATRTFDPNGLAELLACGATLGRKSLFKDIEVLEPATAVSFEPAADPVWTRYCEPNDLESLERVSEPEFLDMLAGALRAAVNGVAAAGSGVGVSLTGGLDSRMIMASLDAVPYSMPCYTFGSMFRTTADVAVAREVAAACHQPHQVIELGSEFLQATPELFAQAVYISDGYLGLSGAAELYLNRKARDVAPERLTGNWGGELMRGVRAFKYVTPKGDFLIPELAQRIAASSTAFAPANDHPISMALFSQVPFQGYGRYAIERSQVAVRAPFLDNDVIDSLYRAPTVARQSIETAVAVIRQRPALLGIPTDTGRLGTEPSYLTSLTRKGLIKAEYLTSHGAPMWLARMAAMLPEGVLETRFLGVDKFQHFRYWLRHQLSGFVKETLLSSSSRGVSDWCDVRRVRQLVDDHVRGRMNYTDELDKLLMLAVAQKALIGIANSRPIQTEWNEPCLERI